MEYCLHSWFVFNNDLRSSCDFHERLLQAETAVYEVVRIVDGKPLFFTDHLIRLEQSAQLAKLKQVPDWPYMFNAIKMLIEVNQVSSGNFKIFLGRPGADDKPVFMAWLIPYFYPTPELYSHGVSVSLFNYQRVDPNAKLVRSNLKETVESLIQQKGVYELLFHHDNFITEGSRTNVFFIFKNTLYTAPDQMVLMGITRNKILKIINNELLPFVSEAIQLQQLSNVQAAFLCGTSPKVLPIRSIDHQFSFDTAHPLIKHIAEHYEQLIRDDLAAFSWDDPTKSTHPI